MVVAVLYIEGVFEYNSVLLLNVKGKQVHSFC